MTDDPNESYDVVPFEAAEGGLQLAGWFTVKMNGAPQWHGPRDQMEQLAIDPAARAEARRSKMHHDRKPT